MTDEEFFYKSFPQFCTEKGECLSPFYDVFEAGVEIATAELNKGIIQSLTKENSELKDNNKVMADNYSKMEQKFYDKLTQAKELLKKIEKIVYSGENEIKRLSQIVDILAEAEQFLNSEVEK